jgi:hypothetical protein
MKTGVLISPWDVVIFPSRAEEAAAVVVKEKLNTNCTETRDQ